MTALSRALALVLPLAIVVALYGSSAGALDSAKPSPSCAPSKNDGAGDSADPITGTHSDALEITRAFLKYEPDKGAEATTANIGLKDLSLTVPSGSTSMIWTMTFTSDKERFVRAVVDFSGTVVYEHGELVTNTTGSLPRYEYRGDVPGKMWEGKDGVIQLVIPAEIGGKDGAALKSFTAEAQSGKSLVPTAAPPTPTRGLSYVNDDLALGAWTVAPCPEGGVTGPTGPTGAAGLERLPVTLLTRSAKAKTAKKGKKLKLKVRSTEAITNLAVQIRSAKKTFARGRLASLNGTATLKLKLRKALKKGAYVVDLVGDDSLGRHRVTAARLRVR